MSRTDELIEVNSVEEIPDFATEDEEAAFWATHSFGPGFLQRARRVDRGGPSQAVNVRFDRDILARLRSLARRKGVGYQTLLKTFVTERLYEEEKREGIIG